MNKSQYKWINQRVEIEINSLNGLKKVSGIITRKLIKGSNGMVEIKTQNDGYFIVNKREVKSI